MWDGKRRRQSRGKQTSVTLFQCLVFGSKQGKFRAVKAIGIHCNTRMPFFSPSLPLAIAHSERVFLTEHNYYLLLISLKKNHLHQSQHFISINLALWAAEVRTSFKMFCCTRSPFSQWEVIHSLPCETLHWHWNVVKGSKLTQIYILRETDSGHFKNQSNTTNFPCMQGTISTRLRSCYLHIFKMIIISSTQNNG